MVVVVATLHKKYSSWWQDLPANKLISEFKDYDKREIYKMVFSLNKLEITNQKQFRSGCPISSSLDLIGDKWSLLIIRDMFYFHKRTFKEFSSSPEKISTRQPLHYERGTDSPLPL